MRNNRTKTLADQLRIRMRHSLKMELKGLAEKKGMNLSTYVLGVLENNVKENKL